ncbi:imidazole glycerol phosphate synthase subunit HisH [uncultured Amnibacterium sp.]|uniref:imidazole glycerol phosphate synthase subunit HisH n=1 Tax=uncultured Amnibacterium sp. TaxID=1631851 RepID=UPI0035C96C2F
MTARPRVSVFDYGSGNVHSAVKALEAAGADVRLTADRDDVQSADGLYVPGVGAFGSVMAGLQAAHGPELIERRLAGGRSVLGVCVGLQVLFAEGVEGGQAIEGLGEWPGTVERLDAPVLPHMGWDLVTAPEGSRLFAGIGSERFYFVHSYGVRDWVLPESASLRAPLVTWSDHGGPFVAAVENGALAATQFHPEKSGAAGLRLLANWLETL